MNRTRLFLLLALTFGGGLTLSRLAQAEPPEASTTAGDVVMQRLVTLVTNLTVRGDTNTLAQIDRLLEARDTLTQTRDAAMTVALLRILRTGDTNKAIAVLEITLDGALAGLASEPQEIGPAQIETLQNAQKYRTQYPRKPTEGVTKAFELLDHR